MARRKDLENIAIGIGAGMGITAGLKMEVPDWMKYSPRKNDNIMGCEYPETKVNLESTSYVRRSKRGTK